jgi:hypothetical protein
MQINPNCNCFQAQTSKTDCCSTCDEIVQKYRSRGLSLATGQYYNMYYYYG